MLELTEVVAKEEPEAEIKTTHNQQTILSIKDDEGASTKLHTFCLGKDGNILAGCGMSGDGHIRIFTPEGKYVGRWGLPIVPEAIHCDAKGEVLVAGESKVVRLSATGKTLVTKEAPHVKAIMGDKDKIREQIINQSKGRAESYARTIEIYEKQIKLLEDKSEESGELSESDQRRLQTYQRAHKSLSATLKRYEAEEDSGPSEAQIEAQMKSLLGRKLAVASISSAGDEIFIATGMAAGYGYQVFKTDRNFEGAVSIVDGLRGCCGQMDVQVNEGGVFVAENSRHRVAHFDMTGKLVGEWGGRDRTGETGFSSCCNPMNVCFGPGQCVYTAEATTGLIKQFGKDGKLMSYVAKVKLVPGCKKVSIASSADGKHLFHDGHHTLAYRQTECR